MNAVYRSESAEGKSVAGELLHVVKHEGYEPFREKLLEMRGRMRSRPKRLAMDQLLNYVSDRRDTINYPPFLKTWMADWKRADGEPIPGRAGARVKSGQCAGEKDSVTGSV